MPGSATKLESLGDIKGGIERFEISGGICTWNGSINSLSSQLAKAIRSVGRDREREKRLLIRGFQKSLGFRKLEMFLSEKRHKGEV